MHFFKIKPVYDSRHSRRPRIQPPPVAQSPVRPTSAHRGSVARPRRGQTSPCSPSSHVWPVVVCARSQLEPSCRPDPAQTWGGRLSGWATCPGTSCPKPLYWGSLAEAFLGHLCRDHLAGAGRAVPTPTQPSILVHSWPPLLLPSAVGRSPHRCRDTKLTRSRSEGGGGREGPCSLPSQQRTKTDPYLS